MFPNHSGSRKQALMRQFVKAFTAKSSELGSRFWQAGFCPNAKSSQPGGSTDSRDLIHGVVLNCGIAKEGIL
jgi:hypothetical protein